MSRSPRGKRIRREIKQVHVTISRDDFVCHSFPFLNSPTTRDHQRSTLNIEVKRETAASYGSSIFINVSELGDQRSAAANTLTDALELKPDEVYKLTRKAFEAQKDVDAIYFQGAILNPLKILDRIETELNTTVVASNPAMLWRLLSKLGLTYRIQGYGKLLAQWPRESL